jgi:hypothetical protein
VLVSEWHQHEPLGAQGLLGHSSVMPTRVSFGASRLNRLQAAGQRKCQVAPSLVARRERALAAAVTG